MNWEELKKDKTKIYPKHSITLFKMQTESGKDGLCWVDKGYKNYEFKNICMFNCYIQIDLTTEFNSKKEIDFADIEDYFKSKLQENCVAHLVARISTDRGLNIEFYVDDVKKAIAKFNEIEIDPNRLIDFDCQISDDEKWENIEELLK